MRCVGEESMHNESMYDSLERKLKIASEIGVSPLAYCMSVAVNKVRLTWTHEPRAFSTERK